MGFFGKSAEEKAAEQALNAQAESIILTTMDLKCEYDILDVVWSDEVHMDIDADYRAQKNSLKKKAASIGADAVIGVRLFLCNVDGRVTNSGNRRWYGTAVKIRK